VRRAAADRGRGAGSVDIIGRVSVLVEDDLERARAVVGRIAGFYLSTDVYRSSLTRQGFGDEVGQFAARWDAGDRSRAVGELGDELLSAFAVFGDVEAVKAKIAEFRTAGLTAPILYPVVPPDAKRPADESLARAVSILTACSETPSAA
jgi:alkanesulfonate monooxygenase SsuD/methylene tetrahydromethanopterin reductase-like flavin-dependent oxidoreductase (luciferase family)